MSGRLKIKRDTKTTNPPSSGQIEVGELAFNALTGKLYTKLFNGTVIEFVGRPICFTKNPIIIMPDVTNFCCYTDILNITVKDLLPEYILSNSYNFILEDISVNLGKEAIIGINSPIFSEYQVLPDISVIDPSQIVVPVTMKQAVLPYNIKIEKPIAIFKFRVQLDSTVVAESVVTINCNNKF